MMYINNQSIYPIKPTAFSIKPQYPKALHYSLNLMASKNSFPLSLKRKLSLVFLAITITYVTSARVLDEEEPLGPVVAPVASDSVDQPVSGGTPAGTAPVAALGAAVPDDHTFSFFLHDILGGTNPSARAVTGMVVNPALNGQVPFAKPNGAVLPVNNGVPVNNANSGVINNNNLPFLTGLGGTTPNVMQNNGNNIIGGGFGFPALNSAQLPGGNALQKLMFGTITVFDDELTEGHDLGSGLVGKAQGFYIASSEDGTSQTMAFNVMFTSGSYVDSLSFFGVHRTAVSESHLAIMGGTGKYVNAKGHAIVKTIPAVSSQHNTDGVETILEIIVYLTY
ncbi:unnamed protein product [Ilex paraguariensis]|uniref:Dirigent protein n=1 Tax=Ilex paraguariensis TaxID=185542 RepID=A0ABC8RDT6_9AQUA